MYDDFQSSIHGAWIIFDIFSILILFIALYVLSRPKMDNVLNRLLIVMNVFDLCYILSTFFIALFYFVGLSNIPKAIYFFKILLTLAFAGKTGSMLSNGSMCIDRCVGALDFKRNKKNNSTLSMKRKTQCYYLLPILICTAALSYNIQSLVEADAYGNVNWVDLKPKIEEAVLSGSIIILITFWTMGLFFYLKMSKTKMMSSSEKTSNLNMLSMLIMMMLLDWFSPLLKIAYKILADGENKECLNGQSQQCSLYLVYLYGVRNLIPSLIPILNFLALCKFGSKFREVLIEHVITPIRENLNGQSYGKSGSYSVNVVPSSMSGSGTSETSTSLVVTEVKCLKEARSKNQLPPA